MSCLILSVLFRRWVLLLVEFVVTLRKRSVVKRLLSHWLTCKVTVLCKQNTREVLFPKMKLFTDNDVFLFSLFISLQKYVFF